MSTCFISRPWGCSETYILVQINAETTAGGLALWSTSLTHSELRTNATDIEASWQQYIDAIINMTVENQITNGGPVIAVQIGERDRDASEVVTDFRR